ncbi:hypothetical protein GLOIN_2v1778052 [Rhizophagus clarus]|uniref:Uncharacterized protein n=1 Tax=Rhizophagus clarus TaxID=94130 RepID=A0A8H3MBD7_9GLOM|nr:hypothetical protein GLOIN_2v1778052 [Rhizophagus clarus]
MYILNKINNGTPLVSDNKLRDLPSNRYPSNQTELENQLACLKHDLDIALSLGIQFDIRNSLLIKNNESFSKHVCQLEDEALQSRVKELKQDVSLTQDELSKMDFLKRKLKLENAEVTNKNIGLIQKALIEKDLLLQEANACLAK